jgi:hypothetical protein
MVEGQLVEYLMVEGGGVTCRGHLVERHLLEVKILEDIMVV